MKNILTVILLTSFLLNSLYVQGQTYWGSVTNRTEWRDSAGLQGNRGAQSGFYETSTPAQFPQGANSWWHLVDVRHSNINNNYAMQFAGSFFDQKLYFRKTDDDPNRPWSRVITEINNNAIVGNGLSASSLTLSDIDGAGYLLNTGAYNFSIQKHLGGPNWATRFFIKQDGKIGINTLDPQVKLQINTTDFIDGFQIMHNNAAFVRLHANSLGQSSWNGITQNGDAGLIYGSNGMQSNFGFVIAPWTSALSGLRIDKDGNVGVATGDTKGYRFAVNGDAMFTKVKVKQYGSWPDYVFTPQYKLPSLQEVETYINQHQHLPGMPSAAEVEKSDGIDIGEINNKLLQKVEELTLYLIEAHKKNTELEERIKKLEDKKN